MTSIAGRPTRVPSPDVAPNTCGTVIIALSRNHNLQATQPDPDLHNGSSLPVSHGLVTRDFSIEMETGTGKAYIYLRTLLE